MTETTWLPVLRRPNGLGESYAFIQRHEHTHAVLSVLVDDSRLALKPEHAPPAVCGYVTPTGWVVREVMCCVVTCPACRRALELGRFRRADLGDQFSMWLKYEFAPD